MPTSLHTVAHMLVMIPVIERAGQLFASHLTVHDIYFEITGDSVVKLQYSSVNELTKVDPATEIADWATDVPSANGAIVKPDNIYLYCMVQLFPSSWGIA